MSRSEEVILTNMCMVYDDEGRILVIDRQGKAWPGLSFPGGHIEKDEPFHHAVLREVYEETGLTIKHPQLCGTKQFKTKAGQRYLVLFYKTQEFSGEIRSSEEGEVFWIQREELTSYQLASDFQDMVEIFEDDLKTEFYYANHDGKWEKRIY